MWIYDENRFALLRLCRRSWILENRKGGTVDIIILDILLLLLLLPLRDIRSGT
jgi:hypothetical protein